MRVSIMPLLAALLVVPAFAELAYESFLIDVGEADDTLIHGNLTGSTVDDLVVFASDEEHRQRRMTVYTFDGADWRIAYAAEVDDDVIFVDLLESNGHDRLLMFRRDHIEWLDPQGWTRRTLVSAPSVYNVPPRDVPRVTVARDVNDDEYDDLVLADFDGYWVWLHSTEAADGWLGPVKVGARPTAITRFRSTTYRPRAIYQLDYDGDGRRDLAFWEDGSFVVYRATDTGFETTPLELELPVDFSSDDFAVSIGIGAKRSDQDRVMLYGVDDYNGDGIGDLATSTLMIEGIFDQSTRYDFYFGERKDGGTRFPSSPDTAIESNGIQSPFDTDDFDNDGRTDFGMASFDIGIGKIIAALLTGSVRFDVDFYVMRNNAYPAEPNVTKPIKFRFSLRSGSIVSGRWLNLGDVNADGITDLLVPVGGTRIEVYAGTGDAKLFANKPSTIAVDFPDTTTPGGLVVADLNDDARDDLVIRFPSTDDEEPNRVGVVLSR